MIRAKIKWAEEGEKPTKYFCSFAFLTGSNAFIRLVGVIIELRPTTVINTISNCDPCIATIANLQGTEYTYFRED